MGKFQFLADMNSFNGKINLENKLGLDMKGEFSLIKNAKYLDIAKSKIRW